MSISTRRGGIEGTMDTKIFEATRITREEMESFGHRDDWNVPALYIHEVQALVDQKVAAAVRLVLGYPEPVRNVYSRRPHRSA